jgi:hypothetical protein
MFICINIIHVIGVVAALHGKETSAGDFLVLDVLEAGLPPQIEHPLTPSMIRSTLLPFSS